MKAGWARAALGEICQVVGGGTPKTSVPAYWGGDIRWATPKDLSDQRTRYLSNTGRSITDAGLNSSGARILPTGSVLLSSRAPIGLVAINAVPMATNQGFKSLVPKNGQIDAAFLAYWLSANIHYLQSLGSGATFKEISKAVVEQIEIPVPPLAEQRRIAQVFDEADLLMMKGRTVLDLLAELVDSIFAALVSGSQHSSWPTAAFPDAYWFQEGPGVRTSQFTTSGVKLLNVRNIERDGVLNLSATDRHISRDEAEGRYRHFLVDPGDLVAASSGITFADDRLLRTRAAFVSKGDLPLCMNTSTIRFKGKDGISDLRFLASWLDGHEFRSQITKRVTGSAQQNFGPTHLRSVTITLPPLDTQRSFAHRVEIIDSLRTTQRISLQGLTDLRATLQQRAFDGEL